MDIQFECERRYESLATCVSGRAAINNVLPPQETGLLPLSVPYHWLVVL